MDESRLAADQPALPRDEHAQRDEHTPRAAPAPSAAAYATHLVGGLLLGAAIVALAQVFAPIGAWQPAAALAAALACAMGARAAETRRGARSAEAGYAAALVAAGAVPFYPLTMPLLSLVAAGLAVALLLARRGRTPLALLAVAAYFVATQHVARVDLLAPRAGAAEGAFLLALVALGALLARDRRARWGGHALAAHGVGIVVATFPLLDALGVTDAGIAALCIGLVAGALFLLALRLDARPLVATASAMLTLAAISFALLALGPALAAVVLLLMGALLVWQAEAMRGYFAPAGSA